MRSSWNVVPQDRDANSVEQRKRIIVIVTAWIYKRAGAASGTARKARHEEFGALVYFVCSDCLCEQMPRACRHNSGTSSNLLGRRSKMFFLTMPFSRRGTASSSYGGGGSHQDWTAGCGARRRTGASEELRRQKHRNTSCEDKEGDDRSLCSIPQKIERRKV